MKKSWDIIAMIFFAAAANIVADIVRRPELTRTVWVLALCEDLSLQRQYGTQRQRVPFLQVRVPFRTIPLYY